VTLGFGEIIRLVANNSETLGEAAGINQIPPPPGVALFDIPHLNWESGTPLIDVNDTTTFIEFGILDQIPYYWLALTVVIIVLIADRLIKDSRVGRSLSEPPSSPICRSGSAGSRSGGSWSSGSH
jgi:branched-chain amino acid transport system permease protein